MSVQHSFPFEIRNLTDEEQKILSDLYTDKRAEKVKFIGNRTCLAPSIRELKDIFYNFKPRPDDVWLVGYPRTGTTLVQEILYLLENDMNYEKAAGVIMDKRFPVLHTGLFKNSIPEVIDKCEFKETSYLPAHELLEQSTEKRFIKSHLGLSFIHPDLLKVGCKVVFMARNPKDVMNSVAHLPDNANYPGYTFKKMWNLFKYDLTFGGNYFDMLQEAWERRHEKNLLILFYEEVNADKKRAVLKIADFLGKKLSVDDLETLLQHIHIDSFKKNKSLNNDHYVNIGYFAKNEEFSFIRTGKNGGWRDGIPQELVGEIDDWVKENLSKIPDFVVPKSWEIAMDLK